jgi:hypothetical protein
MRPNNVSSIQAISARRAANGVLAAGAQLAALKDRLTDLMSEIGDGLPTAEQQALYERLRAEEATARRGYEEAVHRFRFLTRPGNGVASVAPAH